MTPKKLLVVRIGHYPDESLPYTATVAYCPPQGRGTTPGGAIRSLFRRLTRHVRTAGLPEKLAVAPLPEGALRTHLPGIVVDGSPPEAGPFLQAVPWDFKPLVTALTDEELRERAGLLGCESFETGFLHDFPARWDRDVAQAFHQSLARRDGHPAKPVEFDLCRGCNILGEHGPKRIRLQPGLTPLRTWQVFLHELAHYRVLHHRTAFTLELARVYGMWRSWSATTLDPAAGKDHLSPAC